MKSFESDNLAYNHLSDTLSSIEKEYEDKILSLKSELAAKVEPLRQSMLTSYDNYLNTLRDNLGYLESFETAIKYEIGVNKYGVVERSSGFEYGSV